MLAAAKVSCILSRNVYACKWPPNCTRSSVPTLQKNLTYFCRRKNFLDVSHIFLQNISLKRGTTKVQICPNLLDGIFNLM